jgi:hypothetical protein
MWKHSTRFFDVSGYGPNVYYRRARVRTFPVAGMSGLPLLAAGWIFVLDPPANGVAASPAQVLAVALFGVAIFGILVIAPSIFLLNRPKLFVPPHMRKQLGWLSERRRRKPESS